MAIKVGEKIPDIEISCLANGGVEVISSRDLFNERKVVLFSVPGAFTPTCSNVHLPGYVCRFGDFAQRGVTVACMSVNDAWVMKAWADSQNVPGSLLMLADGNAAFAGAMGLEMDASAFGMGRRARRFALYAENGIVLTLHVEAPGELRVSDAETMLATITELQGG